MTEEVISIDIGNDEIINLDADDKGNFIAFTKNKRVVTNDHQLALAITIRFPIIRRLDANRFLIADGRTWKSSLNGFIYNFNGQLLHSFLAGDGIEDILIHHHKIIITYFDEGVSGDTGPNNDGLAIFNLEGKQEFGLNSSAGELLIIDCYCICKHGTNRILFYAYNNFDLVELNLDTFKQQRFKTPSDFEGAMSLSSFSDKIIFHSIYSDKKSFFIWDRTKQEVTKFGTYEGYLKGIKNGKFLIHDISGYTIIDITTDLPS